MIFAWSFSEASSWSGDQFIVDDKNSLSIFVALTLAGIGLIVFAQSAAETIVRTTLPLVGSALFASGLTFFLVENLHFRKN